MIESTARRLALLEGHPDPRKRKRLRVYRAQDSVLVSHPVPLLASRADFPEAPAQAYVDRVTRSAWWVSNGPEYLRPERGERVVLVQPGSGYGSYWYDAPVPWRGRMLHRMSLSVPAGDVRDPWVILHELAHGMVPDDGHGRAFARAYLHLTRRWISRDAGRALLLAYRAEGVRHRVRH